MKLEHKVADHVETVALRKESVDRNGNGGMKRNAILRSLSARRAWIEMIDNLTQGVFNLVALRKESVDRNNAMQIVIIVMHGRSPQGERG